MKKSRGKLNEARKGQGIQVGKSEEEFYMEQEFKTKSLRLSKDDIIRFASEFDPQYMHLNEDKVKQERFNGIIASGNHTIP
ncbi:MaoC like domain protein [compost metagenome]